MEFVNPEGKAFAIGANDRIGWFPWTDFSADAPKGYYSFTSMGKVVQALGPPPPAGVARPGYTWTAGVPASGAAPAPPPPAAPSPPVDPWAASHARVFGDKRGPQLPAGAKAAPQSNPATDAGWEASVRRVTGSVREG